MLRRRLATAAVLAIAGAALSGCSMSDPGAVDTAGRTDITAAPPSPLATSPSDEDSYAAGDSSDDTSSKGSGSGSGSGSGKASDNSTKPPKKKTANKPAGNANARPATGFGNDWATITDARSGVKFAFPKQVSGSSQSSLSGYGKATYYTTKAGKLSASLGVSDLAGKATAADLQNVAAALIKVENQLTGVTPTITGASTGSTAAGYPTLDQVATYKTSTVTLVWRIHLVGSAKYLVNVSTSAFGKTAALDSAGAKTQRKLVAGVVLG